LAHATGAVYDLFRRRILHAVAIFAGAVFGSRFGINGVAVAVAFSLVGMYFLMAGLTLRLAQGNWRQFLACQIPGACVTALITIGAHIVATSLRASGFPMLVTLPLTVSAGVLLGVVGVLGLPRARLPENTRWALETIDEMIMKAVLTLQGKGMPVPFLAGRLEK
jgi:hypothetical protein